MKGEWTKNRQGGFLKLIILIIVAVLILSYFHISVREVFDWVVNAFQRVFS